MSSELSAVLSSLVERLRSLAAADDSLRAELRSLAIALLAALDDQERPAAESTVALDEIAAAIGGVQVDGDAVEAAAGPPPESATVSIDFAAASAMREKQVWPAAWMPPDDDDLPLIEQRCRLKAEAARWAAARQRRMMEGAVYRAEIEPKDHDIIRRAKALPDCFLWMSHPDGPSPVDLSLLDDLGGCFDTVASAVAMLRAVLDDSQDHAEFFEQTLDLVAEAQSSLRAAVNMIDAPTDSDQARLFAWLKGATQKHQIFIRRFMRVDDPADPTGWAEIDARIEALDQKIEQGRQRKKQQQSRIKRVRYHAKLINEGKGSDHDWRTIAKTVDELVADGLPASNRELREVLLPMADDVPGMADAPGGFLLVLREIDRFLALRPPVEQAEQRFEPTCEVREAARLLAGRNVVMIGGERRSYSQQSLRSALGLGELIWVEAKEHQSLETFEPYVSRSDVALVILAIRWSSHSFGDVRQFCERYGKPLVRLPAGYNPNQVASQILAQCSEQLKAVLNA